MNLLDTASLVVTPNGYKASKLYSIIPSDGTGDMTFARTGDTATRVNSSGLIETVLANKPRLDYLGSTCPKLLLEPQRTNQLTYSDAFDNAGWTKSGATISSNAVASPDGTTNADKLVESSNNESHFIYKSIDGSSKTFSFFVKAAGRDWVGVLSDNAITYFNISTGVVGTIASGVTAKIESYGNGWFRCSITSPHSSYGATVYLSNGNGVDSYLGNGTSGVYIFGAQLEAGAYATSYIPTTTASVTRNGDYFSKTSISSLIGQTEGTFFAHLNLRTSNNSGASRLSLSSGFQPDWLFIGNEGNNIRVYLRVNDSVVITNQSVAITGNDKIAIAYKSGNTAIYINGVQLLTNSSSFTFSASLSSFSYSSYIASAGDDTVKLNSTALWKTRLTNQELATLTTI